jgi:23S rRNA pseudouridine1911/1915/1917 synthase
LLSLGVPLSAIDSERPGIVHRLDKDTSGLLLVAKDDETHEHLSAALKRREIQRTYLALVRGDMPASSGSVEAPIGRHGNQRRKMAVTPEGKDAVTHYSVLGTGEGASLLEVRLETGRTHQIRVHLAHLGHPVLGDGSYGGRGDLATKLGIGRPFLHAARIAFEHPVTKEAVEVDEPLPADLVASLGRAGIEVPHNKEA